MTCFCVSQIYRPESMETVFFYQNHAQMLDFLHGFFESNGVKSYLHGFLVLGVKTTAIFRGQM